MGRQGIRFRIGDTTAGQVCPLVLSVSHRQEHEGNNADFKEFGLSR